MPSIIRPWIGGNSYQMTQLKLVESYDPVLREIMPPYNLNEDNPVELFENMKETLVALGGYGLAAPQVGLRHNMFIMGNVNEPESLQAVFNPKLLTVSKETTILEEGCLSFPGLILKIKRSKSIRVRFTNQLGETDTFTLNDLTARVFQHEFDHLNGVLFTKRTTYYHWQKAIKDLAKTSKLRAKASVHIV